MLEPRVELPLQLFLPRLRCRVQRARLEQVSDAENHFDAIDRLREEVLRAGVQRPLTRCRRRVGGQDDDGKKCLRVETVPKLAQHGEPIHPRHVQVEQQHVGAKLHTASDRS